MSDEIITKAFYEHDFALAMAKVTLRLAEGSPGEINQQAAVDAAQATLDALRDGGAEEPADLEERTTERVLEVKANYEAMRAKGEELMNLPTATQLALGIDLTSVSAVATTAVNWIMAIEQEGY